MLCLGILSWSVQVAVGEPVGQGSSHCRERHCIFHQKPVSILTLAPKALMEKPWQQTPAKCQGKHLVQWVNVFFRLSQTGGPI